METGLHGADRDAKEVGDLREREALDVVEDEHGPLLHAEPPEAALELVSVEQDRELVQSGPVVERQLADLDAPTASVAACLAMASPNQQPMELCLEAIQPRSTLGG